LPRPLPGGAAAGAQAGGPGSGARSRPGGAGRKPHRRNPVMRTVTAVILAYGAEPWLQDAVRAALASTDVDIDVVVVDNGCTSHAIGKVKGLDRVRVITSETNSGFSGGCDRGAAEAHGEYLAFVNSDAIVAPAALSRLAEVASEP